MSTDLTAECRLPAAVGGQVIAEVHASYLSASLIAVNSVALRPVDTGPLCNRPMRTVEEVRQMRLAQLKAQFGSLAELSVKVGMTRRDSTLSQILNGSTGTRTGKPKGMGSQLARRLETACGKGTGWMDTDPAYDAMPTDPAMAIAREFDAKVPSALRQWAHTMLLNQIEAAASLPAVQDARALPAPAPTRAPLPAKKTPRA